MKLKLNAGRITAAGLALAMMSHTPTAQANVFASNIKIDGGATNLICESGQSIEISYILNEPASLGATLQILVGTNPVRTITVAANRGINTVTWTNDLPPGNYWIGITAASSGYTNWNQITSDSDTTYNTYVWNGQGIAVDRNPYSGYYGRVFVANSAAGPSPANTPGDNLGILKFNADASGADEGIASSGLDGHNWTGDDQHPISPWKLAVSDDDLVYVDDLANRGEIYRWNPTISSNSLLYVLRQDNQPTNSYLSGPAITGTGTNTQIWMADNSTNHGILKWGVDTNGSCASNNVGITVVGLGGSLTLSPSAVTLDQFGNIYTCQFVDTPANAVSRVFRFPAYNPATNGNTPELTADWAVGGGDDTYSSASGLALDPTGTYLAVAFQGVNLETGTTNGNTKILYATNGNLVANLDLGIDIDNLGDAKHQDTDCAWDAVGNVYYIDAWAGNWRIVSPPGTNQAATLAVPIIQVTPTIPLITNIQSVDGNVIIDFTGATNDAPLVFAVMGAAAASGPYAFIPGGTITRLSPGVFRATMAASPSNEFYRIVRLAAPPPLITNISVSGNNVVLTFMAGSTDLPSAFTVLSSSAPNGPFAPAAGGPVQVRDTGLFQVSIPRNGPRQFYRVLR
jgi:hypothetical protein